MTAAQPEQPVERRTPSLIDETARALTGYYGRLGRIGLDLAVSVLPAGGIRLDVSPVVRLLRRAAGADGRDRSAQPSDDTGGARTLLVEADEGRPGFGLFVVENLTAAPVSAPITVSSFVNDAGHEVRPRLVLRPGTVSLEPGQQAMVQLAAELDDELEAGVRYHGEIAIPALSDRRIPVVLRRVSAVQDGPATSRPAGRARRTTKPRVAAPGAVAEQAQIADGPAAAARPRRQRATRASRKADSAQ